MLLNTWKHHAGVLMRHIRAADDDDKLAALAGRLVVVGGGLMDLYTGPLSPGEIAAGVLAQLERDGRLDPATYRDWLSAGGGYTLLTLSADNSGWVLREGPPGRHLHIHPARGSPNTRRVRAAVLKSAVVSLAYSATFGGDASDSALVNRVRRRYLGLPPLGDGLCEDQGLGALLKLLGRSVG